MELTEYFNTKKYNTYTRNKQIFEENSTGTFRTEVNSRVKLELMGAGGIVSGGSVLSGWDNGRPNYSPIDSLIVPSNLLSSITSAYISYATAGDLLFDGEPDDYLQQKVKECIREQSVGGSCLLKLVEFEGSQYLNIYNALSYFTTPHPYIQDAIESYTIFNKVSEDDENETYMLEEHKGNIVIYRKAEVNKKDGSMKYVDADIEGMKKYQDESGVIYSVLVQDAPKVAEVTNTVFEGNSDYTDDNVALLRELVVTNTLNSQTFDKISNPLLAMPEEALEYDENGQARVHLQDRVVIIRDGGNKPEQITLESKIEQSQIHKDNLENQIFSSLAVNKSSLGISDLGQLSGDALERMMASTISRVEEKRTAVAKAFNALLGVEVTFNDVVAKTLDEQATAIKKAIDGGFMSVKYATELLGNSEDYEQIKLENEQLGTEYQGFVSGED